MNIVLVMVDTLRQDRVGPYGSCRIVIPRLNAFADYHYKPGCTLFADIGALLHILHDGE